MSIKAERVLRVTQILLFLIFGVEFVMIESINDQLVGSPFDYIIMKCIAYICCCCIVVFFLH